MTLTDKVFAVLLVWTLLGFLIIFSMVVIDIGSAIPWPEWMKVGLT